MSRPRALPTEKTKAAQGLFPTPQNTQAQNTHSTLKSQGEMRIMGWAHFMLCGRYALLHRASGCYEHPGACLHFLGSFIIPSLAINARGFLVTFYIPAMLRPGGPVWGYRVAFFAFPLLLHRLQLIGKRRFQRIIVARLFEALYCFHGLSGWVLFIHCKFERQIMLK